MAIAIKYTDIGMTKDNGYIKIRLKTSRKKDIK
jgi:hypothetical protein